jgi:hypothetical protein
MERQVPQVKRKNSTNWSCPDARFTVVGSVAWRSGPREVATGSGVGACASVGEAGTVSVAGSVAGGRVAANSRTAVATGAGVAVALAGAHAARKTASKIRLGKKRVFISIRKLISGNPYEKVTLYPIRLGKGFALTVVKSYAILDLAFRKKNTNQWR